MNANQIIAMLALDPQRAAEVRHLEAMAMGDPHIGGTQIITRADGIRQIIASRDVMVARETMLDLARQSVRSERVRIGLLTGELFA